MITAEEVSNGITMANDAITAQERNTMGSASNPNKSTGKSFEILKK